MVNHSGPLDIDARINWCHFSTFLFNSMYIKLMIRSSESLPMTSDQKSGQNQWAWKLLSVEVEQYGHVDKALVVNAMCGSVGSTKDFVFY